MNFRTLGNKAAPTLILIPGLGVSYEIFLPLIGLLEDRFHIIAVEVDGFTLDHHTDFTSVDDQARQIIEYVKEHHGGHLDVAYGLSLDRQNRCFPTAFDFPQNKLCEGYRSHQTPSKQPYLPWTRKRAD